MQRLASLLLVGALATTATAQITLVAPNGYTSTEGNTNNAYPFNMGTTSMRVQFIYDSSHFTLQGVSSPIIISRLRYRADGPSSTAWSGGSWPNVRIDMASAPQDFLAASTTYANNLGSNVTTVFQGAVVVQAGTTASPGPWYIDIPLTTTFLYDPTTGSDLTVDIRRDGAGWTGQSTQMDHVAVPGNPLGTRVWSTAGSAVTTGSLDYNYAAVCEFTYVPATGYAQAAPYGTGCINAPDVSSYEFFATAATFDLDNLAITLLPNGSGYTAIPGITTYVPPSGSATVLPLTDDSETTVALSSPMLFGSGLTSQLTVCSNGFISPGTGNGASFTPTAAAFLTSARAWLSLAWHDFNPTIAGSGTVKFEEVGGIAYVTWDGVWDYGGASAANANRFQAQFQMSSGLIHIVYQTMSHLGNSILVGFSDAGPSADPGSMDISAALPGSYTAAVFAVTPLAFAASARPVIGTSISLNSTNVPAAGVLGLTLLGLTEFTTGIDLTFLGMPGCRLYASLDATSSFVPAGGTGSSPLTIPANPSLAGAVVLSQSAALVPGINPFGFISSNGVRLILNLQ